MNEDAVADAIAIAISDKVTTTALTSRLTGYATTTALATSQAQTALDITSAKARANHTGSQTSATISDFQEAVQDAVAALLGAGSNITLSYNDTQNTLTVSAAAAAGGTGGTFDAEAVRDAIGIALVGVGNIAVAVNDAADTITLSTPATVNATDAALRDRSTHTGTQLFTTLSDGAESVQDIVAAMVVAGANVTKTYDDTTGTLTLTAAAGGTAGLDVEAVQDAVAAMLVMGSTGITRAYDDVAGTLTLTLSQEWVEDRIDTVLVAGAGITKTYDDAAGRITIAAAGTQYLDVYRDTNGTGSFPATRPVVPAGTYVRAVGLEPAPTWLVPRDIFRKTASAVA